MTSTSRRTAGRFSTSHICLYTVSAPSGFSSGGVGASLLPSQMRTVVPRKTNAQPVVKLPSVASPRALSARKP